MPKRLSSKSDMKRTKLADLDDILRNNMQDERGH